MADNNDNNSMRLASTNGTSNDHSNSQPTTVTATTSTGLDIQAIVRPTNTSGGSPSSPQSADSNSNVPSSSHSSILTNEVQSSRHLIFDNAIKPSISLIPIKQVNFHDFFSLLGLILFYFYRRGNHCYFIKYSYVILMFATFFFIYS